MMMIKLRLVAARRSLLCSLSPLPGEDSVCAMTQYISREMNNFSCSAEKKKITPNNSHEMADA